MVIRVNFVKKGTHERKGAKANIRYIENRRGKDGEQITRPLFGSEGQMTRQQAYDMIDSAEEGSTFFRVKISPDPAKEDTMKDLLLREITEHTLALAEQLKTPITWVATIHDDHTNIRHIHALVVTKARLLPVQEMRDMAKDACLEQRRELDREREQEREGEQWERER